MPLANHQELIDAPADKVWAMMREKIERPDKYVPGVVEVDIVNRFDDGAVERVMLARTDAGDKQVREIISASDATRTVVFLLKDDPAFVGFITNTVFETDAGTVLDYTVNWTPRSEAAAQGAPDIGAMIRGAVQHAKTLAEAD